MRWPEQGGRQPEQGGRQLEQGGRQPVQGGRQEEVAGAWRELGCLESKLSSSLGGFGSKFGFDFRFFTLRGLNL